MPKSKITFEVEDTLYKRAQSIPFGVRSAMLRTLLGKAIDLGDKKGHLGYGAIIGGQFKLEVDDESL